MKNKPLIDNYEQILDNAGYNYCVLGNTFYVYRILPLNMTCWTEEDWKYASVISPWTNKQPYCWRYSCE